MKEAKMAKRVNISSATISAIMAINNNGHQWRSAQGNNKQ
jgi:hypothetical protein